MVGYNSHTISAPNITISNVEDPSNAEKQPVFGRCTGAHVDQFADCDRVSDIHGTVANWLRNLPSTYVCPRIQWIRSLKTQTQERFDLKDSLKPPTNEMSVSDHLSDVMSWVRAIDKFPPATTNCNMGLPVSHGVPGCPRLSHVVPCCSWLFFW